MMSQSRCTLIVRGLDCPNEVETLRTALEGSPGVTRLGFDLLHGLMTVDYETSVIDHEGLLRRVRERAGMQADLAGAGQPETASPALTSWWSRHGRWVSTVSSGLALGIGLAAAWLGPMLDLEKGSGQRLAQGCFALAVCCGGAWLVPRAVRSLRRLRLDIDVLMGLAILGALGLGQWDEAATVAFLFGLSESLESLSLERARRAIRNLLEIAPQTAERIRPDGTIQRIPAGQVRAGDRVLVRAGDTIPIDGNVVKGRSSVDQKTITGESVPVERGPGDSVYAGTVSGEGTLEIEACGPVSGSLISRIVAQVREAQAGRAAVERRISRFAAIYTPVVVVLSLLVMVVPPLLIWVAAGAGSMPPWPLWHAWFYKGLVILVIACPCALVIATPVAVVSGLAAAARCGVLIKGGAFLEEIGRLRALAFDKTGTLTLGQPDVVEVVCAPGQDDQAQVLRIAAALGDRGGHVLGKAIARHARGLRLDVPVADDYRAIPGKGGWAASTRSSITSAATATSMRPASVIRPFTTSWARPRTRSARQSRSPRSPDHWAGFAWPTSRGPKRPRFSTSCTISACGRSCSPATMPERPRPWPAPWASASSARSCCRPTRSRRSQTYPPATARPAWSATASTTRRPWPPPA